jgi:hypothetical protein
MTGNHDYSLDPKHSYFNQASVDLFTSSEARKNGIIYIDRAVRTVAYVTMPSGAQKPINVYGNPMQPNFLGNKVIDAFTYPPYPSEASTAVWAEAPIGGNHTTDGEAEEAQIWAMHGPPRHRFDVTNRRGFYGCEAQAAKIASAKPKLCVFGHFHFSWGVEKVQWKDEGDEIAESKILTLSPERKGEEHREGPPTEHAFDFSEATLDGGRETVFVNAAFFTMKKRRTEFRNHPIVVNMTF